MNTRWVAVAVLAAVSGVAAPAFAHEHKVLGTIKSAAPDHLTMAIRTTEGKDATIKVLQSTRVTRDKAPVRVQALTAGTRVVVTTASDESPYVAIAIEAGPPPAPSGGRKK